LSGRACFYADEICARRPTDRPTDERTDGQTESLPLPFASTPSRRYHLLRWSLFSLSASPRLPQSAWPPLSPSWRDRAQSPPPPAFPPPLSLSVSLLSLRSRQSSRSSPGSSEMRAAASVSIALPPVRASTAFFAVPPPPPPPAPLFRFLTLSGCSLSLFPSAGVCHPSFPRLAFSLSPDPFVTRCYPAHSRGSFTSSASFLFLPSALDCRGCASRSDDGQE